MAFPSHRANDGKFSFKAEEPPKLQKDAPGDASIITYWLGIPACTQTFILHKPRGQKKHYKDVGAHVQWVLDAGFISTNL